MNNDDEIVSVEIRLVDCQACIEALFEDCRQRGLPHSKNGRVRVHRSWMSHRCSHGKRGIILAPEEAADNATGHTLRSPRPTKGAADRADRWKDEVQAQQYPWERNMDASKNWGYPCREGGRYGSFPAIDGFDDESVA